MGATDFLKVQLGQESSWGTSVVATAWLMGVTDRSFELVDENYQSEESGHLAPSSLVAQVKQSVAGQISYDLTYEDILYMLTILEGGVTWLDTMSAPTNPECLMAAKKVFLDAEDILRGRIGNRHHH